MERDDLTHPHCKCSKNIFERCGKHIHLQNKNAGTLAIFSYYFGEINENLAKPFFVNLPRTFYQA